MKAVYYYRGHTGSAGFLLPEDMALLKRLFAHGSLPPKGVTVTQEGGRLVIALHIKVGYGLNIASISQSITHRVKDEVEHATGLRVARIDVYVDDILAD